MRKCRISYVQPSISFPPAFFHVMKRRGGLSRTSHCLNRCHSTQDYEPKLTFDKGEAQYPIFIDGL